MMLFKRRAHPPNARRVETAPEFDDRKVREFWRELARPVTFFDLCSPRHFGGDRNRRIF